MRAEKSFRCLSLFDPCRVIRGKGVHQARLVEANGMTMKGCRATSRGRRTLLLGAMTALCLVWSASALAQSQRVDFNIPAQPLRSALLAYSAQAGIALSVPEELVGGRSVPALTGSLTAEQALQRLLQGTGIRYEFSGPNVAKLVGPDGRAGQLVPSVLPVSVAPPLQVPDTQIAETMTVTGSRIRGAQPAAPLHVIGRTEIDQSGYSQVADLIRSLPENFSGGQNPGVAYNGSAVNQNITGISALDLRGLGPTATLTLLNGHRLAGDAYHGSTDISGIPLAALERIEIVTDGASALYGSDAVAGVANFILRKNYEGAEVSARIGGATQGGGFETTYGALGGTNWGTGHALLSAEYTHQNAVNASDRAYTSGTYPANALLPASQRKSVFANGEQSLTDWASVHFDGLYSERQQGSALLLSPLSTLSTNSTETKTYLFAPGVTFQLPREWTASVEGQLSDTRDNYQSDFVGISSHYREMYRNATKAADVNASGPVFELPSGKVQLAVGAGYRSESFNYHRASPISSVPVQDISRDIRSVYGEMSVPLVQPSTDRIGLQKLELNFAARFEDYSDFGTTTNPKVGVRYQPIDSLILRGTWGKSFKAPTFNALTMQRNAFLYDASTVGGTTGTVLYDYGGNPNLAPERSKSWTVGFDWTPSAIKSLQISASYFNINYTDRVIEPLEAFATILSDPTLAPFVLRNPSAARQAALISSTPHFYNYASTPYNPNDVVALLLDQLTNAAAQDINGIDLSVRKSFALGSSTLDLFGNGSWMQLKQQTLPTSRKISLAGTLNNPPRLRVRSGASWSDDNFTVTGIVNYISSEADTNIAPSGHIASWTTVDFNFTYHTPRSSIFGDTDVSLSVQNLFDRDPPYAKGAGVTFPGVNFDSTNASALGRFAAVTLRKRF